MELTFTKAGGLYVAEFTATADFALHIEKPEGYLRLKQSSVEGAEYAFVRTSRFDDHEEVIDEAVQSVVYPIHIQVVTTVEPTMAIVTSEGDITEGVIVATLNNPV